MTISIGRLMIILFPKQTKKKNNPFDIVIPQPALFHDPSKTKQVINNIFGVENKNPKLRKLFDGLWSEKMFDDYAEYCKANKEGRYYPDPRD